MSDVLILGAGPAGLTAAIYAARSGLDVTVYEKLAAGGQVALTSEIENYPGFASVTGAELAEKMRAQAEIQGAKFTSGSAKTIAREGESWTVTLTNGNKISAPAVIAATGARRRKLDIPGEAELTGAGVSYCATCDGGFFRKRTVAVVGGGSAAFEDALYLARICEKVYLVHRREGFRAEKKLVDETRENEKIEFVLNVTPERIEGDDMVERLVLKNVASDEIRTLELSGVFVAVGAIPETEWLAGAVELDGTGYVLAGEDCVCGEGLFVAGDLRKKPIYQIVTAVADGAVSADAAAKYLSK